MNILAMVLLIDYKVNKKQNPADLIDLICHLLPVGKLIEWLQKGLDREIREKITMVLQRQNF